MVQLMAQFRIGSQDRANDIGEHELVPEIQRCSSVLREFATSRGSDLLSQAPVALASAASLFAEGGAFHRQAIAAAPKLNLSPAMVAEALRNFTSRVTADALANLQRQHLASAKCRPLPTIVFHILAGNLFISGLESMLMASLAGACSIVRCSSDDTIMPFLWLDALRSASPDFAASLLVAHWPTTDEGAMAAAAEEADVVVAFGSDASISAMRSLTPPSARFVGHGSKVSFAVIGDDALASISDELADGLAYDFTIYDQQGCLSPRAAFIQGDGQEVQRFANNICERMRHWEELLPLHELSLPEAATMARQRDDALVRAATGEPVRLVSHPSERFVVTLQPAEPFQLGCVNRFCDLRHFHDFGQLARVLAPYANKIATFGSAGTAESIQLLARRLRVPRISQIGKMQNPPLEWTHDGRLPLTDLTDFSSIEL